VVNFGFVPLETKKITFFC